MGADAIFLALGRKSMIVGPWEIFRIRGGFLFDLPPMVQAAVLMIGGALCVATQNAIIRVASADIHTFEIVFFRNLFGLAAMLPLLASAGPSMLRVRFPGRAPADEHLPSCRHGLLLPGDRLSAARRRHRPFLLETAVRHPGCRRDPGGSGQGASLERRAARLSRRAHRAPPRDRGDLALCPGGACRDGHGGSDILDDQAPDRPRERVRDRLVSGPVRDGAFAPPLPAPLAHARHDRMGASGRDRRTRHAFLAFRDQSACPDRRLGGGAVRVPAPPVRRADRLSDVRGDPEAYHLARRCGHFRRRHLHRAPGGRGRK